MAIIPGEIKKEVNIVTPQQAKTKKMVYLLVAIVVAAALILYFGRGGSSVPSEGSAPVANLEQIDQNAKLLEELNKVNFDNLVFKDKKFEALILNGQLPISVGTRGRENPFAPF